MTKSLLLLPLLVAACVDEYRELPADPTTPVETRPLEAGDAAIIATGGTQGFAIDDPLSVGLSGETTGDFEIETADHVWPNTRKPEYFVRALASGVGSFEIFTNRGIASGSVESAAVANVTLVPASYELDGHSAFAVSASRTQVQAVLVDRDGRRLVDATLGLTGEQTAWDSVTLPQAIGTQSVHAYADSFGERDLEIDVVGDVTGGLRVESVVLGDRTCFHAYAGSLEVATAMTITGGTPDPHAANCALGVPTRIAGPVFVTR